MTYPTSELQCDRCRLFGRDIQAINNLMHKHARYSGPWGPGVPEWLQLTRVDNHGRLYFQSPPPFKDMVPPHGANTVHLPAGGVNHTNKTLQHWIVEFDECVTIQQSTAACAAINRLQHGCQTLQELRTTPTAIRSDPSVRCLHTLLAREARVRRMSENHGRTFFQCPILNEDEKCSLFVWGDAERADKSNLDPGETEHEINRAFIDATTEDVFIAMENIGIPREAGAPKCVMRTPEERMAVMSVLQSVYDSASMDCWNAEQGTRDWHRGRSGRITASVAASAQGLSAYCTPAQRCREIVWSSQQDSVAMRWGRRHEDDALVIYQTLLLQGSPTATFSTHGLWINPAFAYLGASPDAIVCDGDSRWCAEIKCPFKLVHRKKDDVFFGEQEMPDGIRVHCTIEYYVQTQMQMFLMGLPWCDFIACSPTGMQVTRIPISPQFIFGNMLPALQRCCVQLLYPCMAWRSLRALPTGSLVPHQHPMAMEMYELIRTSPHTVQMGDDDDQPKQCTVHHIPCTLGTSNVAARAQVTKIIEATNITDAAVLQLMTCVPITGTINRAPMDGDLFVSFDDIGVVARIPNEPTWLQPCMKNNALKIDVLDWMRIPLKSMSVYMHIGTKYAN